MIEQSAITQTNYRRAWWSKRRWKYNKGLIIAGVCAFLCYSILGDILIEPYDHEFEVTLFTLLFQGTCYLIMMGIANLFYSLGYLTDVWFNKKDSELFRANLYNAGYWFSFGLPFLIPVLIVVQYFTVYAK